CLNILVIKQTSLGDVLNSTGHIRTLREHYPQAKITLLTANNAHDIYKHNPNVDQIILFDRYMIKRDWWRRPLACIEHISEVMNEVRDTQYDKVFDLQGSWKTALFMYGAKTSERYVKGNWWFAKQFRDKRLHAIAEMDGVLRLARVSIQDSSMEFATSVEHKLKIETLLQNINPKNKRLLVLSPITRWPSKNWPMQHFIALVNQLDTSWLSVFAGSSEDADAINDALGSGSDAVNLAGKLSLPEFAELLSRADAAVTGDSFPMHLASAQKTPLVTLFGPTDESRVGPVASSMANSAAVLRHEDCNRCYEKNFCAKQCLSKLLPEFVAQEVERVAKPGTA
ncbi:MAG: glycosyltransferase family 9 protein, partial [Arenicellales bacterium WSBS_2016_MAG_OTU3]